MQFRPEAEGEEAEAVEGAGASTMEGATAKEVKTCFSSSRHFVFGGKVLLGMIIIIGMVSSQHFKCVSSFQVDLERMVTGTVLTPDTVSIHFTYHSSSVTVFLFFIWAEDKLFFYQMRNPNRCLSIDMSWSRKLHLTRTAEKQLL